MFLGYNTNGFAHHRLDDAISILADLGYRGIALTLDVHHLDPFAASLPIRLSTVRQALQQHHLHCVIETGARFLLDPTRKHQPTLISPTAAKRQIRLQFLKQCVEIARELGAGCVSFWSGTATDAAPREELMQRLEDGCRALAEYADLKSVRLAFEPEPGMLIDRLATFAELHRRVDHPAFGLTIDIGHLMCMGELPASQQLRQWARWLWNVHIEDMKPGVHDHLMFGEGSVDFADVFEGLREASFHGGIFVELSRHSYNAVETARAAYAFLKEMKM